MKKEQLFTMLIDRETKQQLEELSRNQDRSQAAQVRTLIRQAALSQDERKLEHA